MSMLAKVSVLLCIAAAVHRVSSSFAPEVTTTSGPIRGGLVTLSNGKVFRQYLGVPFATAERFKPPQAPTTWTQIRNATTLGKACPQPPSFMVKGTSEDCLNLNLYLPNTASSGSSLPVMVWIHGGAFVAGSNAVYDGGIISTRGNVIVVGLNYRLGALGFIATGKEGLTGNYGMLDQVEGLKWVKNNIKKFGGNPAKVTIFGESAGGTNVALLMLSPLTSGLYNNAIIQSGSATAVWSVTTYSKTKKIASTFGKSLGCESLAELAKCLESKSTEQLVSKGILTPSTPVIDGTFLPAAPWDLLASGTFDKKNIMIGVTNDEGSVMTTAIPGLSAGLNVSQGLSRSRFQSAVRNSSVLSRHQTPQLSETIIYRYTDWSAVDNTTRNRRMYVDLMSDAMFVAPAISTADSLAKAGVPTYFYQLETSVTLRTGFLSQLSAVPSWVRAYHGADIFYLFGFVLLDPNNTYTADGNLTRDFITMWTNFAKTGDPNRPESVSVTWPLYNNASQQYISLKPDLEVNVKLRPEYMAFWNVFVPQYFRAAPPTEPPCPTSSATRLKQIGSVELGIVMLVAVLTRMF